MSRACSPYKDKLRKREGFSLVMVLSLGLVATMWVAALVSTVLPIFQRASQNVPYDKLRDAAESGIDKTLADLNVAGSAIPAADAQYSAAPQATMSTFTAPGTPTATVTINVWNVAPQRGISSLYESTLDITQGVTQGFITPFVYDKGQGDANPWRVIEATAQYGNSGPSVMVRTVVCRSTSTGGLFPMNSSDGSSSAASQPLFNAGVVSGSSVDMDNVSVAAYDSSKAGNPTVSGAGSIVSNGLATFGSNVSIDGNLTVSSVPVNSTVQVASSTTTDKPNVSGDVTLNGTAEPGLFTKSNVDGDINESESTPQSSLPGVPPPPPTATNLGNAMDFSSSSYSNIMFVDNPQSVASPDPNTLYLAPGDYIVSGISSSSAGQIQIDPNISMPVRIFVEGTDTGSPGISISGDSMQNNSASAYNMQLWYNRTDSVNIGNDFQGTVFAPLAPVKIQGSSSSDPIEFRGSVVGNTVSISNANLNYDYSLGQKNYLQSLKSYSNLMWDPTALPLDRSHVIDDSTQTIPMPFTAVTYQEIFNPQ